MTRRRREESGFTLPEVLVTSAIIAAGLIAFTVFVGSLMDAKTAIRRDLVASRVLADQMEALNGAPWVDLLVGSQECTYMVGDKEVKSAAAVRLGPETVEADGNTIQVNRDVNWGSTAGDRVTCANAARSGLKAVTVTVTYVDGEKTTSTSLSELRSQFLEAR